MKDTRMVMLARLTESEPNGLVVESSLFKTYIPKFYPHIYSLYSLLNSTTIESFEDFEFKEPVVIDNSITIAFLTSTKNLKELRRVIGEEGIVKEYIKDKEICMSIKGTAKSCKIVMNLVNNIGHSNM
jgi:hypothetical protein